MPAVAAVALEVLDVGTNVAVGGAGLAALAMALPACSKLAKLGLTNIGLTDDDANAEAQTTAAKGGLASLGRRTTLGAGLKSGPPPLASSSSSSAGGGGRPAGGLVGGGVHRAVLLVSPWLAYGVCEGARLKVHGASAAATDRLLIAS